MYWLSVFCVVATPGSGLGLLELQRRRGEEVVAHVRDVDAANEVHLQGLVLGAERRPVDIAAANEPLRRLRRADVVGIGKRIGRPERIECPRAVGVLVVEVHELRRVREDVVRAAAVVVVAGDAAPRHRVRIEEVGRRRQRAAKLLRDVGADRLLVVAGVEQRPVVVLREPGQEVLGRPLRAADAQVGLVRGLRIAEELVLIVLRAGVDPGNERIVGCDRGGCRVVRDVVDVPRLRAGQRREGADVERLRSRRNVRPSATGSSGPCRPCPSWS